MEKNDNQPRADEDISATMMRRARCLHVTRYSMDTSSNITMLSQELPSEGQSLDRERLLRLWYVPSFTRTQTKLCFVNEKPLN